MKKKGCLWAIGIFALLAIIGNCVGSSEESTSSVDSNEVDKTEKASADDEAKITAETANEDSLNAVKIKELKKYFTEENDEFSDTKWVEPQTRPRYTNQNGYCLYFALKEGKATNPRFRIQYEADEWLFIQYMIFNIDGDNITFTPTNMETDNGNGGRIWEWCDESALDLEPLIKKIAYANTVKIKMVGRQYSKVKTMSSKQIQYFKYSYEYYKALGGTFN